MKDDPNLNVKKVAVAVQILQQNAVLISQYHIDACASILDIQPEIIRNSLQEMGHDLWPEDHSPCPPPQLPISETERLAIFLHFGHYYSKLMMQSHPKWGIWLGLKFNDGMTDTAIHDNTRIVLQTLRNLFDKANEVVKEAVDLLESKGFCNPTPSHVYQYSRQSGYHIPSSLLYPAVLIHLGETHGHNSKGFISYRSDPVTPLFEKGDEVDTHPSMASESFGAWGFKDSGFVVKIENNGSKSVIMKGNRYKISGRSMPKLIPFLENETNVEVDPLKVALPKSAQVTIPSSDLPDDLLQALRKIVSNDLQRMLTSDLVRARHGTGHSQEDMYMIRNDTLSQIRLPDGVIYPENEDEVKSLVSLAAEKDLCLIPFGGGTNVCHATWCPPKDQDPRPMITVDMRRMNKILSINEEDSTIHVQAGITGGDLVREMASRGYTIGHEPDSIEFSTLGGWIATKASGMKQNRYGNIEGIVKEVRVISSCGELWQHNDGNGASFARVSTGTDLSSIMLGSEGSLGIITSAVMRIWPVPQVREYESVILHKFEDGLLFMKDVSKLGALKPASVRLLDNTQFRLGQAMQSKDSTIKSIKRSLTKIATSLFADNYRSEEIVCATVTFEGSESEVHLQTQHIRNLASKHGGLCAGSEIGKSGYDMTYAIAYIRDFAMTYGFLAESFETFVPWSKLRSMINATKERLKTEHEERALPGNPIITCRVTQLYDEGVCVYFYFCMNFNNVKDPSAVFADIELAARLEILAQGGSLSHHHGIGKHRAPLMDKVNSEGLRKVFMNLKDAVDPDNVFGVRNGTYSFQS
jgi:alkyldihydroxyacetonephosphate synthase